MVKHTVAPPRHIQKEFLDLIKLPDENGKSLNYLIIMPRLAEYNGALYVMPYGMCMVSSALKASGRNVFTLNLNYKEDADSLIEKTIRENNINIVATGGLSAQIKEIKEVTDAVKRIDSNIITMVGGGIITADPVPALEAIETADFGMVGEGEITINEIAYALEHGEPPHKVEGVIEYGRDYSNAKWKPRKEIEDLNILPFPDYDGFEFEKLMNTNLRPGTFLRKKMALISGARSCPFNCTFCFHSAGKKYRRRTVENIVEEINWLKETYGIESVMFVDELFAMDLNYLKELTSYLKQNGLKYAAQTRADMVTNEHLKLLKDTGCFSLCIGLEHTDERILKSMQKKISYDDIERSYKMANETGLNMVGNILLGDIEETEETAANTLEWWKAHPEYNITVSQILTFPGSQLYKSACERGIIKDKAQYLRDNNMLINVTKLPDADFWEMIYNAELFQILTHEGIDVNFKEMNNIKPVLKEKLENILKSGKKIALWPTTVVNVNMLNNISPEFILNPHLVFVNMNQNSSFVKGASINGKKLNILTPDKAFAKGDIEQVLYAFNSKDSEVIQNSIFEMAKAFAPNVECIKLTDLLK